MYGIISLNCRNIGRSASCTSSEYRLRCVSFSNAKVDDLSKYIALLCTVLIAFYCNDFDDYCDLDPSLIVMCCYSCTCAGGFEGDRCETNIDDCPGHRCQNNATCLDGIDGYTCNCLPGFTGDQALIVRSGTDLISLLILFFLLFLLGRPLQKSLRLRRFKSDRDEIWQDCSSSKFVSIDGVTFSIWRHAFKMAAVTSFHATKCCHLVSKHEASAGAYAAEYASSWSLVHLYTCFFSYE